jgi:hypothetical protein
MLNKTKRAASVGVAALGFMSTAIGPTPTIAAAVTGYLANPQPAECQGSCIYATGPIADRLITIPVGVAVLPTTPFSGCHVYEPSKGIAPAILALGFVYPNRYNFERRCLSECVRNKQEESQNGPAN